MCLDCCFRHKWQIKALINVIYILLYIYTAFSVLTTSYTNYTCFFIIRSGQQHLCSHCFQLNLVCLLLYNTSTFPFCVNLCLFPLKGIWNIRAFFKRTFRCSCSIYLPCSAASVGVSRYAISFFHHQPLTLKLSDSPQCVCSQFPCLIWHRFWS